MMTYIHPVGVGLGSLVRRPVGFQMPRYFLVGLGDSVVVVAAAAAAAVEIQIDQSHCQLGPVVGWSAQTWSAFGQQYSHLRR